MHKVCLNILKELEAEGINIWWDFKFPEPKKLEIRLKDLLEEEVDEKYYLSEDKVEQLLVNTGNWNNPQRGRAYSPYGISPTVNTGSGGGHTPQIVEESNEQ